MKVLHINRNYLTSPLHQIMINHLNKTAVYSKVFAPTDDMMLSVTLPNPNVIVCECFSKIDRFFYRRKQKKIRDALETSVDMSKFDLIHAYTLFTDGNCAMELSQKYNIPYIVAVRNTDVNDFFKKLPWLYKHGIEIMKNASKVIFLSPVYRDQVFEHYVPEELKDELSKKIEIIPNGIDDFWLENQNENIVQERTQQISNKVLRVIYVGRIDRNKNILSTIQVLKQMSVDGWKVDLTVVGKVIDKRVFKRIRQTRFVRYVPAQPKEELRELYRQNDIFIMPSFTETFGLVYAEAMSQGLPVVYSKGQGFDGQFNEGVVGYHADPYNLVEIREAIQKIVENYDRISKNCPQLAQRFRWGDIVSRYESLYEEILNGEMK